MCKGARLKSQNDGRTTSFERSIAATFTRTVTDTVCDTTRECALAEKGRQCKVKHSR